MIMKHQEKNSERRNNFMKNPSSCVTALANAAIPISPNCFNSFNVGVAGLNAFNIPCETSLEYPLFTKNDFSIEFEKRRVVDRRQRRRPQKGSIMIPRFNSISSLLFFFNCKLTSLIISSLFVNTALSCLSLSSNLEHTILTLK